MVLQRLKNDQRKYELIENQKDKDEIFGELNAYIKCILQFLWDRPNIVADILSVSNIKDVKNYLAHFFTNNFYENILSNNNKEEQLLYIITSLLKKEINNLNIEEKNFNVNNIENKFLNNTPCGFIFEEFCHKKEIQSFFKMIILDLIEKLELSYPSQEIVFNPDQIRDIILLAKKEEEKEKKVIIKKEEKNIFGKKDKNLEEQFKLFNEKYQFGLQKEELEKKINQEDIKQNKNMINYINNKISECSNNPFLFSTEILLENINFTNMNVDDQFKFEDTERKTLSKDILSIYQQSFFLTINMIDKLFENLLSNIHLLPYSIKCINKIISLLIKKKYPNLFEYEINIFTAKFFFNKLFFPIFMNPAISALINDFIISDNTIFNISTIITIINKFISGEFYEDIKEEGIYTPFNWYFLNKMPILLDFFEKASDVKLPNFIQKIIDDEKDIENDYEFDYFEENKEEIVFMENICFSFDDFYYLFENMKNNKDIIFKNKNLKNKRVEKALEKLIKNVNKIEKLKKKIEKISYFENLNNENKTIKKDNSLDKEKDNKQKLNFFLISQLLINKKYSNLLNMKKNKEYFYIKEIKNSDINLNNTIKAKNFICALLYNFHSLDKINLDNINKIKLNTLNTIKELKKYVKTSDLLNDEKIPSNWYINSIIEYLKKLPENLVENDYNELFNQLENDINSSIKSLNFEDISLFIDKIKLVKRSSLFYEKAKKIMIDIDLNQHVQSILEKEPIPVEIKFRYNDKEKKFNITPYNGDNVKEKLAFFSKYFYSYEKMICQTIKQFTDIFPNIIKYNELQDLNVFKIIEELKIPQKLNDYFEYIGKHIKKLEIGNEKEFNNIQIKIYDYVMEKLYDKLFPDDPDEIDLLVFQNCVKSSWVELKNLVKGKNDYILENFLPDTIKNFEQINKEKSPRKKLKCVEQIFKCINYLALLNGDIIEGTDDSLPILNFAFIKARPFLIYSNCQYIKLFLGDKKNKVEGHQLSQLLGICMQVSEFSAKSVFDVTEEEFNKNCLLASQEEI